jgi:hypothetical protein
MTFRSARGDTTAKYHDFSISVPSAVPHREQQNKLCPLFTLPSNRDGSVTLLFASNREANRNDANCYCTFFGDGNCWGKKKIIVIKINSLVMIRKLCVGLRAVNKKKKKNLCSVSNMFLGLRSRVLLPCHRRSYGEFKTLSLFFDKLFSNGV